MPSPRGERPITLKNHLKDSREGGKRPQYEVNPPPLEEKPPFWRVREGKEARREESQSNEEVNHGARR